jgi:hypothetical protein
MVDAYAMFSATSSAATRRSCAWNTSTPYDAIMATPLNVETSPPGRFSGAPPGRNDREHRPAGIGRVWTGGKLGSLLIVPITFVEGILFRDSAVLYFHRGVHFQLHLLFHVFHQSALLLSGVFSHFPRSGLFNTISWSHRAAGVELVTRGFQRRDAGERWLAIG